MKTVLIKQLLMVSLLLTNLYAKQDQTRIIYGEDDRHEVLDETNSYLLEVAKAVAVMLPSYAIKDLKDGRVQLDGETLEEAGYCSSERFSSQISPGLCSAFLVGPDLLVTAGHCIKKSNCSKYSFVFNFELENLSQKTFTYSKDQVYSCKEVLDWKLENSGADYAVVRLNKVVPNVKPLKIRKRGKVCSKEELVAVGHPIGLPKKITSGGKLRKTNKSYYVTNLDTYGGNSGSVVVGKKSKLVEGILVRGGEDFRYNGSCYESRKVGEYSDRGEDVTRITVIKSIK